MEFSWDDMTIRWFENASEYTGFHKNLAGVIRPMLGGSRRLCDLGCGLGKLALEFTEDIEHINCLDINPLVILNLRQNITEKNISNITARIQNCQNLGEGQDVLLTSYFGSGDISVYLRLCRKLIMVVDHMNTTHLYPKEYKKNKRNNSADIKSFLNKERVSYRCVPIDLEFGQPFISFEDAGEFVNVYAGCPKEEIADFLNKNLVAIQHDTYSWYLPHEKSLAVFEIEGKGKDA